MGVIGDVVGDGGDLGLGTGEAPELQILGPAVKQDSGRQAALAIGPDRAAVAQRQRPVVLDQTFQRLPGEVQSVESGIAALQRGHHPQRLRIVIEAAAGGEAAIEGALAGMAEGRVAEIVRERQRLGQILVQAERASERASDLGNLERMGQSRAEMVAFVKDEDLGLVGEPPEGAGMDDAVAVAAEGVAGRAHRLRVEPAAAPARSRTHRGRARLPLQPPCRTARSTKPVLT